MLAPVLGASCYTAGIFRAVSCSSCFLFPSSVATPGSSCLLRKAMCGCLILGTGHVTFHLPTCTAAAQTVSNLSTRSEVGCLQLQSYISRQHVIHGDDRTCTFRYSEEASESSDLVALICSLLCAVLDLGKVAGSSRHGKAALGAGL